MALQNLGMRISESISESTRDINFIGRSPNAEYFDANEDKLKKVKRQLDSTSERDILDAMKRLVAVSIKNQVFCMLNDRVFTSSLAYFQRTERIGVLRSGCQECRLAEPRDSQTGVYLPDTLRRY